nr:MAG TPA: hypothetical protein [Bacteriophage sp.]
MIFPQYGRDCLLHLSELVSARSYQAAIEEITAY